MKKKKGRGGGEGVGGGGGVDNDTEKTAPISPREGDKGVARSIIISYPFI